MYLCICHIIKIVKSFFIGHLRLISAPLRNGAYCFVGMFLCYHDRIFTRVMG